jgi:hypothetical protein
MNRTIPGLTRAKRRVFGSIAVPLSIVLTGLTFPSAASGTQVDAVPGQILDTGADNYEQMLWGQSAVRSSTAWTVTRGAGVTVAVLDTGVDGSHPDLAGRVVAGYSTVTNQPLELNRDNDPGGHGTHVAGIIAAAADGRGVVGVAPDATILPIQVLGTGGSGSDRTVARGIDLAVEMGAGVINLSLGGESNPFDSGGSLSCAAVGRAFDAGSVVVVAAGNDGSTGNPRMEPASCRGALSVAALDEGLTRSYFSSFDASVKISAPGSDILSSVPSSRRYPFEQWSGTSMAAPFVAGVAALVRAAHPQWSPQQVVDALTSSAVDLGPSGHDPEFGAGLVDAASALGITTINQEQRLEVMGRAALPVIVSARGDGKAVELRWRHPRNLPAEKLVAYELTMLLPGAAPGELLVGTSVKLATGTSARLETTTLPAAVRLTAQWRSGDTATSTVSRTTTPFYGVVDGRPGQPASESAELRSATAQWTNAGVEVRFTARGPRSDVHISINAGVGAFFLTEVVQSDKGRLTLPVPRDSVARSMSARISMTSGKTSKEITLAPQYRIQVSTATAGPSIVSIHGKTNEACNSRPKAGCGGSEILLRDAANQAVIARTKVMANLRFGFDLPRRILPEKLYVTVGSSRSMVVARPTPATGQRLP